MFQILTGIIIMIIGVKLTSTWAASQTTTFLPTADSYVNSSSPQINFGNRQSLRVDGSPILRSYIRFNIQGLTAGITRATLRIYANSSSRAGLSVWEVVNNTWSEKTLTFENAPAISNSIAVSGAVVGYTWKSLDVTSYVKGNGNWSFALQTSGETAINLASRESGANTPQLVIETEPLLTPTPTPTPGTVGSNTELTFPIRAAFYYSWFPQAWTQSGIFPYTNYYPSLGYYNSSDTAIIKQHISAMQYGKIQAGIASWWGQGTHTDGRISTILQASDGTGFRWALYHEMEGSSDPTAAQIQNDLTYMKDRYWGDPNYLKIGGRPVVFVYANGADGCGMADRWKQGNTVNAYIVLKVFTGYKTCVNQPQSWHQYSPAVATSSHAGYSYSISPGFWLKGQAVRLARDLTRWQQNVRDMVASKAPWQLITTFSEWGEGTIVESAQEWASVSGYGTYLDALHNDGVTGTTTPTPTPTKIITISPTPIVSSGTDPILIGAGDIAYCSSTGDEATANLLDAAFAGGASGIVFTAGDNVYTSGTYSEFLNCYNSNWGRQKARTKPAVGNHEYLTTAAAGYFDYFNGIGNGTGAAGDRDKGYYSYNLGDWHIVVLNSNCSQVGGCGAGSKQEQWLRADLAANPGKCQASYFHHPRFSSGSHGSTASMQPLWQALYDYGVDIVLSGHDHLYERFALQTPSGVSDSARGIREFIVGTGGKNHYLFSTVLPNSEVRNSDTFGVLKLNLHTDSYDWQFMPEVGKTFTDSGTQSCH